MCIRTVDGDDITVDSLRTVGGEDSYLSRNISGLVQTTPVLLNTPPTITKIIGPNSGTYTTPAGCIYIDVYVTGAGGGGAGGETVDPLRKYGGGGGGGDVSFGIFAAGIYTYALHSGAAGGATNAQGIAAAQFSTFDILNASGGDRGLRDDLAAGKWSSGVTNSLVDYGYSLAIAGGLYTSSGGYNLFNGKFGRGVQSSGNANGRAGEFCGGGGGGGCLGGSGSAGAPSTLIITEYY